MHRPGDKTILIADDCEDDVFLLKRVLKKARVLNTFKSVHSGKDAIAYLAGEPPYNNRERFPWPVLLFLDLKLDVTPGFEVLAWLRDNPPSDKMVVIVLTGSENLGDIEQAYRMGATSFLTKPINQDEVSVLISSFPHCWKITE